MKEVSWRRLGRRAGPANDVRDAAAVASSHPAADNPTALASPTAASASGATRGASGETDPSAGASGARSAAPRGLHTVAAGIIAAEPWLAAICAALLLCAPNPLIWPAAVVGVLPWIARLLTTGRLWRATPFDVPLLLLAIGAALGGYASLSREGALIRLTGLLAGVLLFAALREHATGIRALRRLVVGLLIAAVAAGVLLLVLVGPFLILEKVPPVAGLVAAIDRWSLGAWFVDQDWLLQRYRFRASGVGALADIGLALACAALVGFQRPVARVVAALTLPFFAMILVVADNRGSMLAGALTLALMAVVWRRRLLPLLPVSVVAAVLVVGFLVGDRGLSLKTLAQRFWFWENSLYLAREVPLTGAGLGLESVQLVYRAYFLPSYPPFSHAHNVYLQGLLEYGVFGLVGLVGLAAATLWVGWRATDALDRWTLAGRLAGCGLALTMLTTGMTEIVLLSTVGGVLVLAGLGLLAATTGSAVGPHPPAHSPASGRGGVPVSSRRYAAQRPAMESSLWDAPRPSETSAPPDSRQKLALPLSRLRERGLGGEGFRFAFVCLVVVVALGVLVVTPAGPRLGARLLLNAGTAELNRGALSESLGREERAAAIERAVPLLQQASALNPNDLTVQRNLGLALSGSDDSRRARAVVDRAEALTSPDNAADLLQLGRAYVAVSAWGEAIRAWEAAEAAPQLLQLGNRLIRNRNFDQAINAFIATARVDPQSRGAYAGVTEAAADRKSTVDEQLAELEPLLQRDAPTEFGARLQAARILRETGRLYDAGVHLDRAEELGATPDLSFESGRLMYVAGQPDAAIPLLVRPVADLPYDPAHWFWLARAQADAGQHDDAIATIQQGLSKLDTSGQFAPPAVRLPETAAVRATEIKRAERAELLGVMAESMIRLGRATEALPLLDEATAALPKDGWLATTRDEARAAKSAAAPNLLMNPAFARSGSWALRRPVNGAYSTAADLPNMSAQFDDGQARLVAEGGRGRLLTQEVSALTPGRTYRLTMHLRAENLGDGAVAVHLTNYRSRDGVPMVVAASEATAGTTVTVDAVVDEAPYTYLVAAVGFTVETPPGAILWCDEATLTVID